MKKLALILAISFITITTILASPHPIFEEGQQLFVVAQSGLSLRTGAGSHHELITIIPYGEIVQILAEDSIIVEDRIDWISGRWIAVHYDGDIGYVFDGFLSPLALPIHEFEKSQSGLDLIYPLESWVSVHLHPISKPDTVSTDYSDQITQVYESGDVLIQMNAGNLYKVKLELKDVRLMDAYHLLKSMLNDKYEIDHFEKTTLFLADDGQELERIKINLDDPIDIRYTRDGQVIISITSREYECRLL